LIWDAGGVETKAGGRRLYEPELVSRVGKT
jgi:hypothetical protein